MKKIRCFLAAIALAAALSGPSLLQGMGSIANAASSRHTSSSLAVGQLTRSHVFIPKGPCPSAGGDC